MAYAKKLCYESLTKGKTQHAISFREEIWEMKKEGRDLLAGNLLGKRQEETTARPRYKNGTCRESGKK